MTDKPTLRKDLRGRRAALAPAQRARAGRQFAGQVSRRHFFRAARTIAVYHAIGSELPVDLLAACALRQRKCVCFPVLLSATRMEFAPVTATTYWRANDYGIPEPVCDPHEFLTVTDIDLVIAPLLGFTADGARLGMGGGFYDRTFRRLRTARRWQHPKIVGAAYECQRVDTLARDPWDIAMWRVATESRLYLCDASGGNGT